MYVNISLKNALLFLLLFMGISVARAQQNYFESASSAQARTAAPAVQDIQKFAAYRLNETGLRSYLAKAPLEFQANSASLRLDIPLPDGTVESFAMRESPILAPAVAARHPEIKTYTGTGLTHRSYTIRLSFTANGFDAIILGVANDAVYYTKASSGPADQLYITYFARDAKRSGETKPFSATGKCGSLSPAVQTDPTDKRGRLGVTSDNNNTGTSLRTFRLAMAATGEFTQQKGGGNVTTAFNALVAYVNRMNAVYRVELSVAFTLVSDVNLVFPDAATDPYTNADQIKMLSENQTKLDLAIGTANYDVGHVLGTAGGSGGGVAATPSVCAAGSKAQGASGVGDGSFAAVFDDQLISHEIGHQFGMSHTFNSSLPVCTTREPTTSVEPGAGTTIMSYGYTCDDKTGNDNYETPAYQPFLNFHTVSYQQAVTYINTINCFTSTPLTNAVPVISGLPASVTIPKSTPFTLSASATDGDAGDVLSYAWEGTNIGTVVPDGTTLPNTAQPPFFRSYPPATTGTRYYPRLSAILNGTNYAKGDKLPSVGIATTHRLTVRDNAGGLTYGTVTVTVDGNSGPFLETTNLAGSYPGNSSQTITWDVANTTAPPVNCANVAILLSTDGGQTFPTTLLANTPNDGTEPVTLPTVLTSTARIKIMSVDNIFFDISNVNFSITAPAPQVGLTSPDPIATEGGGGTKLVGNSLVLKRSRTLAGPSAGQSDVTYSDPATLRFERTDTKGTLVVKYSLGGSANGGSDFVSLPGSVTFADGESVQLVEVDPIDDDNAEGDESLVVTVDDGDEYDPMPGEVDATIIIKDNDSPPSPPASLTITSFTCVTTNSTLTGVKFVVGNSDGTFTPPVPNLFINGITIDGHLGTQYSFNFDANQSALPIADQASRSVYFTWNFRDACAAPVTPPAPMAPTAPALPNQTATQGTLFSYVVPAFTGTTPIVYTASGLPDGLTFDAGSRTISGTPTTVQTPTVTISASNVAGQSSGTFTIAVSASATQPTGPATLTITSFTCITTNSALTGVNFVVGYSDGTFSPAVPNLFINGITITGQLGTQYGLSFDANQSLLTVQDQDTRSTYFVWNYRQACAAPVTPPAPVAPTAPALPNQTATQGTLFSYVVPAFTGTTPIVYTASGLPDGLTFDAGSRTISGTPTTVQTPTVTISASNAAGQSSGTFTIAVSASAVQPTGPATLTITSFTCITTNSALTGVNFVVGYSDGTFSPAVPNLFINGITITGQLGTQYGLSFDANQNTITVQDQNTRNTYFTWNFRQACSNQVVDLTFESRVGAEETAPWQVQLRGNPTGHEVVLLVTGAQGQPLQIDLLDATGRTVQGRAVVPTSTVHREVFDVQRQPAGLLLLRTTGQDRQQTLKVLKQ